MSSDSSRELHNPKRLKTLCFGVKFTNGNSLLHNFVLESSDWSSEESDGYIAAMLRTMPDFPANARNDDGLAALHLAVLKNNFIMVKSLLSSLVNIDVNARCDSFNSYNTALHLAAKSGHLLIISELLRKGSNVSLTNADGRSALSIAAEVGNLDVIKLLVSTRAYANQASPLPCVVSSGNLEAVKFLLSRGVDVNAKGTIGETPLFRAVQDGHLNIVNCLVCAGADVNEKSTCFESQLYFNPMRGNLEIFMNLFNAGVNVNDYSSTPLCCAVERGNLALVKYLIGAGADVNGKGNYGKTPLRWAMELGNSEIIKFLVGAGADGKGNYIKALHYAWQ